MVSNCSFNGYFDGYTVFDGLSMGLNYTWQFCCQLMLWRFPCRPSTSPRWTPCGRPSHGLHVAAFRCRTPTCAAVWRARCWRSIAVRSAKRRRRAARWASKGTAAQRLRSRDRGKPWRLQWRPVGKPTVDVVLDVSCCGCW